MAARTAADKATPLTFLKRRRLPRYSALPLFSSVGKQTKDTANHFVTRRELVKTLKMVAQSNVRLFDSVLSNVIVIWPGTLRLITLEKRRVAGLLLQVSSGGTMDESRLN